MRRRSFLAGGVLALVAACTRRARHSTSAPSLLPSPERSRVATVDEVLAARRSIRDFSDAPIREEEISRLLWAAQGVTVSWGGRTAPSAGALYPIEVYVATSDGLRRYLADRHASVELSPEDRRARIAAATGQEPPAMAPVLFVLTGVVSRTEAKYGDRAERFVQLEAGHACQNLLLEATALGLAAVPIGSFSDDALRRALDLGDDELPLYVVPTGRPAT